MDPSVLQDRGDIPGTMQRLHQSGTDSRVQRIERRSPAPPLRFGWIVGTRRGAFREYFQRPRVLPL